MVLWHMLPDGPSETLLADHRTYNTWFEELIQLVTYRPTVRAYIHIPHIHVNNLQPNYDMCTQIYLSLLMI